MENNQFSISVVIPNYNGEKIILETISCAIKALKTSNVINYEIIVSDDASEDNSISFIEKKFSDVKILKSKRNTGFSGNVNRGVKVASKELVLILNSDLHLGETYFETLLPLFEQKNVFGVMGLIKDPMTGANQDGAKIPSLKFKMHISSNKNKYSDDTVLPTFFVSGANALVRRDYFLQLEGFCELFNPYYCEDVDLGIRAWRMGWELYFQPNAACYHQLSYTINQFSPSHVRVVAKRNRYILHALHLPQHVLFIYNLNLLFISLFRFLKGDKIYFKAFKAYFSLQKPIRKERVKFNKLNKNAQKLNLFQVVNKIKSLDLN